MVRPNYRSADIRMSSAAATLSTLVNGIECNRESSRGTAASMTRPFRVGPPTALLAVGLAPSIGWGGQQCHEIVATIAANHLDGNARAYIAQSRGSIRITRNNWRPAWRKWRFDPTRNFGQDAARHPGNPSVDFRDEPPADCAPLAVLMVLIPLAVRWSMTSLIQK